MVDTTHYHGGPIWGGDEVISACYKDGGALISFHRPDQIKKITKLNCSVVLDNGAFSYWKMSKRKNLSVDWDKRWTDYYMFVWGWFDRIDWFIVPDVIEGSEQENDRLISRIPEFLKSKAVPVWHSDESIERLIRLCKQFERVAIGCCGPHETIRSKAWFTRMHEVFKSVYFTHGLNVKLHGLRMLDGRALSKFPFDSADSTNVAINTPKDKLKFPAVKGKMQRAAILRAAIEKTRPPTVEEWLLMNDMYHLTLYHNGAILPMTESEPLQDDPEWLLGEPDQRVGSLRIWNAGDEVRIVVSAGVLTTAP